MRLNQLAKSFSKNYKVVFLRHGESQWNKENRFTGWHDVTLSHEGIEEARNAGKVLKENGYQFDLAFTSVLTRAIQTWNNVNDQLLQHYVPVVKHWRLNERHYGALTGLNKIETAEKHGEQQVKIWRRSYDVPPPPMDPKDPKNPINDPRYADIPRDALPLGECLKDNVARTIPFWNDTISPAIISGKRVAVVAHGNSLRSIIKYIDNISEKDILELNIPTSTPLVYEFNQDFRPVKHYYLGDQEAIKKKIAAVANQGSAKK